MYFLSTVKKLVIFGSLGTASAAYIDFTSLPSHPRLLFTQERVKAVLSMNGSDTYYRGILASLKDTADSAVASPLSLTSATAWSSTIRMNVGAVAGTFLLTNDTIYSDWVADSIILLSKLSDWDTSNFLTTADIAMTVSIGYDWTYDVLTADQRKEVESAIATKSLVPALNSSINSWSEHTNNWAQVTHGCLIIAALAIGDTDTTVADSIMDFSFPKLNVSLEQYAPDGGWIEGYSYGTYAGIFLGLMMGSLETATGDDLGISKLPGMSNLGTWLTHGFGQTGGFSWADGAWTFSNANSLWSVGYWAQKFNSPEWLQGMLSRFSTKEAATFQAFVFYNSSFMSPNILPTMPRYNQFAGTAGMTYRTSWEDSNGWFFGFMGGFNGRSHGHLDAGSFVIDYQGYRWAELLGSDSYSLTQYFVGPRRWTYYRCRSEGANTLSISNTTQSALHFANQIPSANNSLRWVGSFDNSSRFGIANLSEAYANVTSSVLRGVAFLNGSQILIRDEIHALKAVDIATSWHTVASVNIDSNNRSATLTQGSVVMNLTLLSPPGAFLELEDTNPCNSYSPCAEATNTGIYNLAVRLASLTTEANISVVLMESGNEIIQFNRPLSQWYPRCEVDCWDSANIDDPYWLRNSEIYY
ncbi:Heparinase II/III family protein [Penicillium macrosclerotiorum]|uniref:Heparinase II/III family protein n=1 Tax=Penicillium macrosclerotiorum TaxID=303699 RepID=UPI002546AA7F|nr:Heparinase II/III family protein [Penicillium macrosclerotiorum]KAJ5689864.1 Heparinase II/III family protein [Penicillium macrosclerotiorum]